MNPKNIKKKRGGQHFTGLFKINKESNYSFITSTKEMKFKHLDGSKDDNNISNNKDRMVVTRLSS